MEQTVWERLAESTGSGSYRNRLDGVQVSILFLFPPRKAAAGARAPVGDLWALKN